MLLQGPRLAPIKQKIQNLNVINFGPRYELR
jgi:hypothetical protein